jgi:hypothetical protein
MPFVATPITTSDTLADLDTFKVYANIGSTDESSDEKIELLLQAATRAIQNYCGRSLLYGVVAEVRNGTGRCRFRVRTLPVASLTSVIFNYGDSDAETVLGSQFKFDAETGEIELKWDATTVTGQYFPRGFQNLQFNYVGGYATVPEDLQVACCATVARIFNQSKRDTGLTSERIGDYSYTVGESQASIDFNNDLFADLKEVLNRYKVVEP